MSKVNEINNTSQLHVNVIGGGVYLKNKPQNITITWEIKDDSGNRVIPDTLFVNNIKQDPTLTSKTFNRVFSDVDFTVRAVKGDIVAIGTTTARFVGPTQTVENSLDSYSHSTALSANQGRILDNKIENATNRFKGLFLSVEDLSKKFKNGVDGDWAIVGESIPAPIFIWNKNQWEASGGNYDGETVDLTAYSKKQQIAEYTDDYNVSKNHQHSVKVYDDINWSTVKYDKHAPVFRLGDSYDSGEIVNMVNDEAFSYKALNSTNTAPYLTQKMNSFTLEEAISFLPEDLRVSGQKISFYSSEKEAWMTYVFTGGDYTNPTYWEIFTNNIDPDTDKHVAELYDITEELDQHVSTVEDNLNSHITESNNKFDEIDQTLEDHSDRMDDIEDEILMSSVEAACSPKDVEILADRAYKDHTGKIIADEYVTRNNLTNEIIDITNQQVTDLKPGSVDPEDLSEATKQLLGNKNITNLPDEEDITVDENNLLKFKDKEYSPKDYSGMGRKVLRKHYVNGVNTLTQHMINKPNTIYIIQYDYDLNGQTITIPEGCTLLFKGGSINNGTLNCSESVTIQQYNGDAIINGSYIANEFPKQEDEEDIYIDNNLNFKFSDKEYNPSDFSGLGRIYLRKNLTKVSNGDGTSTIKNILTQDMINKDNTIYIIQYDYDLNNNSIRVPDNCIIIFQGGTLRNGNFFAKKIIGNGSTVYCTIESYSSNSFINDLIIDCEYKYDTGLYIHDSLYSNFRTISVRNYNKIGVHVGNNCYECNLNNIECISRKSNTTYKYNIGFYVECTDIYLNQIIIKHNHIGMWFTNGGGNHINNVHIWGEKNNRTAVGIIAKSNMSYFNNIYLDTIVGDKNKSPYDLLDANIEYSYNGGIGLLILEYSIGTIINNVIAYHSPKDTNENNIMYVVGNFATYDNNTKIYNLYIDGRLNIDNIIYKTDKFTKYNNKVDIYNVVCSWGDDGITKGKCPNILSLKKVSGKTLNDNIYLSDDDDAFDTVNKNYYINSVLRKTEAFNKSNNVITFYNSDSEELGILNIDKEKFRFNKQVIDTDITLTNTDLDTVKQKGTYYIPINSNNTNGSFFMSYNDCRLTVIRIGTGGLIIQILSCIYCISYRAYKTDGSQTWNDWIDISLNKKYGDANNIPLDDYATNGSIYIDSDNKRLLLRIEGKWYSIYGTEYDKPLYGDTSNRPNLYSTNIGIQYFDTTLDKPIWWTGTQWVDATGAQV